VHTPILIDSDVLVWLTRGHPGAAQRLNQIHPWCISVVTYIELAQGCRDKAELARLKKGLAAHHTEVLPITPAISQRAANLIDTLALSHGMRLRSPHTKTRGYAGGMPVNEDQQPFSALLHSNSGAFSLLERGDRAAKRERISPRQRCSPAAAL
jgi:predicted nucleic acid-binding protein